MQTKYIYLHVHNDIASYQCRKAPITPNGEATAFVQRSENQPARCGVAAKYA